MPGKNEATRYIANGEFGCLMLTLLLLLLSGLITNQVVCEFNQRIYQVVHFLREIRI